jgi:hypothetical protein
MALIKCHECGKDVSTEATACPNCGAGVRKPSSESSGGLLILGIFVVGVLVVGLLFIVFGTANRNGDGPILAINGESQMKEAVGRELYDPSSAQFRNIQKSTMGYCGEVNAKNRMGGYVGFKRFHASEPSAGSVTWNVIYAEQIIDIYCKN